MADRRAGDHRRAAAVALHRRELVDLGVDRAVRVHDSLRIRRRARRVRDERRRARVDGGDLVDRLVGNEVGEREIARVGGRALLADDRDPFEVGQRGAHAGEVGEEVLMAEAIGGDERLHPRLAQDVADLLGAVEVHDRHHDRAEVRDRVEGRGRLEPVRELERDRVARLDPAGAQPGGDTPRQRVDVAERASVRLAVGVHGERVRRGFVQPRSQERAEALSPQKPSAT